MIVRRLLGPLALLVVASQTATGQQNQQAVEFFEKKVRPILVDHCYACHSADTKPAGGLRVDDRNGLIVGGNTGPAVVPGSPEKSLLLKRSTQNNKRRMPLEGQHLSDEQIATLTTWIKDGAAWPALRVSSTLGRGKPEYDQLKKEHWAFQPLQENVLRSLRERSSVLSKGTSTPQQAQPLAERAEYTQSAIDEFLLAKLREKKLAPVGRADRVTLIRRVTFDLTGLPPSPAEIDAFVKDDSPKAFDKLVDRLLAAPAFGERWGRHWLDVARYGESTGPSRNIPYPHAWKYRDYVIDAVNADVPFDRFLREQIAGDLLPATTDTEANRLRTATGFLALGVKDVNQRFKVRFLMDNVDEQIDAVTRATLGLTVSCARCHDHKFDPVPMTDYYALAGIFTSTENASGLRNQMGGAGLAYYVPDNLVRLAGDLPPPPADKVEKLKAEVAEAKKAWDGIRGTPEGLKIAANGFPTQRPYRLKYEKLQGELNALTDPAQRGLAVHGVREGKVIADTELRVRGEAEKLGPVVPRGFLTTFEVPDAPKVNPKQSGRLELAAWLTSPKNPLTPRVAVNRVWQHLFGRGIVSTVDNFGITGAPPSHPELLDFLAAKFIADGWSVKKLVRELVLTEAYQRDSKTEPANVAVDPANVLLWRHAPRRLSAEEIRDATLAAAGTLDRKRPVGTPAKDFKMIEMRDNGPEAKTIHEKGDALLVRSVYLPLLRGLTPKSLEAFDPVEQTLVTGTRDATTVPSQALFLLNSPFVRKQSLALAEKLLKEKDDTERVRSAYRLVLGRTPSQAEIDRARAFVGEYESAYREVPTGPAKKPTAATKAEEPPPDPDQADQTGVAVNETIVRPKDARTAAWLAFTQALFASAEFRYVK